MTELFNGRETDITGNVNSLLFEWKSLGLKHWLSWGVKCEDLDDCWQTEDSWGESMTELFNGRETYITCNENSLLFEWQSLWLKTQLSQGVIRRLPWLFPVAFLWYLSRPFLERGMLNTIWVCGDIVCLVFCLSMSIKRWEPIFWRDNCSHVWLYVRGI